MLGGMRALASRAERSGAKLYVEPINRYQNDLCVTIADALRLRDRIKLDTVALGIGGLAGDEDELALLHHIHKNKNVQSCTNKKTKKLAAE